MENNYHIDLNQVPQWARKAEVEQLDGEVDGLRCLGCGHTWATRTDQPQTCPDCNASLIWDETLLNEPHVVSQSDVPVLSEPITCEECGEEIEIEDGEETDSTESDDSPKTLGDLLGSDGE